MKYFLMSIFLFNFLYADMQDGIKEYKNGNKEKALEIFRNSCDNKEIFNCLNTGNMFLTGKVLEKNMDYAKEFYKRSCDLKVYNGCFILGKIYMQEKNNDKALEYLDISCDKDFTEACLLSAVLYKKVYQNNKQYISYLNKTCEKDDYQICSKLGIIYYIGEDGVEKDNVKAFKHFDKACIYGNINEACMMKGYMTEVGYGIEQNYFEAETIYKDLCAKNYEEGCKALKNFYKIIDIKTNKSYLASKQELIEKQKAKNYVIDSTTKLMWQDDIDSITIQRDYNGAVKYCEELILGDFDDWRLPNRVELLTLYYKNNPTKLLSTLKNAKLERYWSSTKTGYLDSGYSSDYSNEDRLFNDVVMTGKEWKGNVRCVRGEELDERSYDINYQKNELVKMKIIKIK